MLKLVGTRYVDLKMKKLQDWNKVYLTRIVWMLFSGKDTLWIASVKANLLNGKSFWVIKENA